MIIVEKCGSREFLIDIIDRYQRGDDLKRYKNRNLIIKCAKIMIVDQILLHGVNAWRVIEEFWKVYAIRYNFKSKSETTFIATWDDEAFFAKSFMITVIIDKQERDQILVTIVAGGGVTDFPIDHRIKEIKKFLQKRADEQHVNITIPKSYPKYGTPL